MARRQGNIGPAGLIKANWALWFKKLSVGAGREEGGQNIGATERLHLYVCAWGDMGRIRGDGLGAVGCLCVWVCVGVGMCVWGDMSRIRATALGAPHRITKTPLS